MRKTFFILYLLLPLVLTGCLKSDEEAALTLVKTGYLDGAESAPVGDFINGYKYFETTEWSYFKTEQGQKIVQVDGYVNLWSYSEDWVQLFKQAAIESQRNGSLAFISLVQLAEIIQDKKFLDAAEMFKLRSKSTIQFAILPNDRFEVIYQGNELTADEDALVNMPARMKQYIDKSSRSEPRTLDNIYRNIITSFPNGTIDFYRAYNQEKQTEGSVYNQATTTYIDEQKYMAEAVSTLIPGNKSPSFIQGALYTKTGGGILVLFQAKDEKWYGSIDTSTESAACSIKGVFEKTSGGFRLKSIYDNFDGSEQVGACQMTLKERNKGNLMVNSDCHREFCGMNGFLDGDFQKALIQKF